MAIYGWTVTFGTARRGLGGAAARPGPSSLYQMDMFLFQLVCLFCLTVTAELLK